MMEVTGPIRYRAGVPVYRYRSAPDIPSVSVLRFDTDAEPHAQPGQGRRHIHDFPVLIYVERAEPATLGTVEDGDVYVLAAGAAIDPAVAAPITAGRGVYFDPTALGGDGMPWSSHPLLLPFLHGIPGGLLRLRVPPDRRPAWSATLTAIETELADRAEGHRQAVLAHLTLLLVDVARLVTDVVGDLRRSNQPLLAEVFDVIQQGLAGPLSLREVAMSVGVTPGYLTTLVRQRTGRTVVDWITEQRMVQARRLLTDTDLPVGEVARRVGIPDPGYFARVFRRGNGMSPRDWRRRLPGR